MFLLRGAFLRSTRSAFVQALFRMAVLHLEPLMSVVYAKICTNNLCNFCCEILIYILSSIITYFKLRVSDGFRKLCKVWKRLGFKIQILAETS